MSYDKNISPIGWYIGSYILRFVELNKSNQDDPESRPLAWENTIIVKAESLSDAYDKVVEEAKLRTEPYEGGLDKVLVQWIFEGVTELLPIYEEFEHGSELMYKEHTKTKLKNLRNAVKSKNEFGQ